MSLFSKKKNVFEQIAILKTANEIVINRDLLKSQATSLIGTKGTKDPFTFLIDLLTVVSGSDSINKAINNMVSNIGNVDNIFKSKIKEEITNTIGGAKNNGELPANIKNGFKVHINKLDYNGDLFIQEGTTEHELYLSDFQLRLQKLIKQPNTRLDIDNTISGEYNPADGFFTFFPKNSAAKYKDFLFSLVDGMKFNDPKSIITGTFSDLFNGKKLNNDQNIINQKIEMILNNISVQTEEDDSYYKFTDGESELINEKITTNYDFYNTIGSSNVGSGITNEELLASVKKYGNFNASFFSDVTKKISSKVSPQNAQSTANGFLSKFLNGLRNSILKNFLVSPQVLLVFSFVGNVAGGNVLDPINDIKKNKALIQCLIKAVINAFMKSLFDMLKRDILIIVGNVAALYIIESANRYKKIIQNLFKIQ